jgi:hypothetical protein
MHLAELFIRLFSFYIDKKSARDPNRAARGRAFSFLLPSNLSPFLLFSPLSGIVVSRLRNATVAPADSRALAALVTGIHGRQRGSWRRTGGGDRLRRDFEDEKDLEKERKSVRGQGIIATRPG